MNLAQPSQDLEPIKYGSHGIILGTEKLLRKNRN